MSLNSVLVASYLADLLGFVPQPNLPGFIVPSQCNIKEKYAYNNKKTSDRIFTFSQINKNAMMTKSPFDHG
jgi:hypothetical protein